MNGLNIMEQQEIPIAPISLANPMPPQTSGSILVRRFRETAAKLKDPRMSMEGVFDVGYSTGFLGVDFANGIVVHVKMQDGRQFKYNSIGLVDGSANTFIGRSGCGKSTLVLQMAADIIRPFPNGAIYHDDIEGGMASARKSILTGMSPEELDLRYIYRNAGITVENFYQRIKMIHDDKLANVKDYEYDTGLYDTMGRRIFKLQPTVYIMDSIPLLLPDKMTEEEELSGQMSTTSGVKANSRIFRQIIPLLKTANIILLVINHIMDDVQINQFQKKPKQIAGLNEGERLPGGKTAMYLANNLFRLDDSTKLIGSKEFGIDGSVVNFQVIKSRTNKTRRIIPLVFNFDLGGFDKDLSLFLLLKNNEYEIVHSKGAYFSIGDCPVKFLQKEFKTKLAESIELQQEVAKQAYIVLSSYLSDNFDNSMGNSNLTNLILQQMQNVA